MGEDGPISIPAGAEVEVGRDGAILVREGGERQYNQIARFKLVNPNVRDLKRADDGFFELPTNQPPAALDEAVKVIQGAYESSNVNPATAMVQMINQTRMFDLNMRMLQTSDQNARQANVIMTLSNF